MYAETGGVSYHRDVHYFNFEQLFLAKKGCHLRYFNGNVLSYIEKSRPDMVLVVYNPGVFENNNFIMFDFLASSVDTSH